MFNGIRKPPSQSLSVHWLISRIGRPRGLMNFKNKEKWSSQDDAKLSCIL